MGARSLVVASISMCLFSGTEHAYAQSAPGEVQVLPPVEVSAPPSSAKRGHARQAARAARRPGVAAARSPRVVYVYPTTPTAGAGSGSSIDVHKVPASL